MDVTGHARDTIPAGSITAVTGEAGNLADLDRLAEAIAADDRRVDVVYAGAGTPVLRAPLSALTPEIFESIFSVNVRGTQLPARSAI